MLVIGFGPFPGAPRNPSAELVRRMARLRRPALAGATIATAILPTTYRAVFEDLPALLHMHDPDAVIFFGLAARTPFLRIETRAVNRATAFYPDMLRAKHETPALLPGCATELAVRANVRRLAYAARAAGIDARLSRDAGRYICNASLYQALLSGAKSGRPRLVAFVHIPRPRVRVRADIRRGMKRPTMETLVAAGGAVLRALAAEAMRERG